MKRFSLWKRHLQMNRSYFLGFPFEHRDMLEDGEGARAGFVVTGSGSKDTRSKHERNNNSQVTVCPRANARSPLELFVYCLMKI